MKRLTKIVLTIIFTAATVFSQSVPVETLKKTAQDIKSEAVKNPQTLNYISYMADVIGQRITWSDGFEKSIEWSSKKLSEIGLIDAHIEEWEPGGKAWDVKKNIATQITPYYQNLIAYPKHFSPGTKGTIKGKAVYMEIRNESDLEKYKGKLKGAVALTSPLPNVRINYNPLVVRNSETDMKKFETALAPSAEENVKAKEAADASSKNTLTYLQMQNRIVEFCMQEGALMIAEYGNRTYGTINSLSALLPKKLASIDELFYAASNPEEETLPQIVLSLEQYDSIVRAIKNGIDVNLEITLETGGGNVRKGKNVIAEIPGTDLKNEIVMIGAHIDTQGPSVGATDNAAGAAVCMEAMRILKQLDVKPRRTIRIGLWGGEEQGYLGSKNYVSKHFADGTSSEKCFMYFNTDNGAGKFRGLYMEERADLVPMMKKWFSLIDMNLVTTINKTSNTDHVPFNEKGIPGFQFIQDMLDYMRVYHTNMDRIERIPAEDIRDNAIIMASLAYLAAME